METLDELIDAQLIDVYCPRCQHSTPKQLKVLRAARDIRCSMCDTLIVANTSKIKLQIKTVERQMTALHRQLMDTLTVRTLNSPDSPPGIVQPDIGKPDPSDF